MAEEVALEVRTEADALRSEELEEPREDRRLGRELVSPAGASNAETWEMRFWR